MILRDHFHDYVLHSLGQSDSRIQMNNNAVCGIEMSENNTEKENNEIWNGFQRIFNNKDRLKQDRSVYTCINFNVLLDIYNVT